MPIAFLVQIAAREGRAEQPLSAEERAHFKAIVQEEARRYGGQVLQVLAQRAMLNFVKGDPISFALALQDRLANPIWAPIQVLHAGQVAGEDTLSDDRMLNTLLSLQAAAWPGQILLSAAATQICQLPPGIILRDLGVHLLADLLEPRRIYQVMRSTSPTESFPPLRTLSQHAHNLPAYPTPFIGREETLEYIIRFFRQAEGRWLTLLGPGGIGKTRLALQAGARLIEDFADGVYRIAMGHLGSLNTFLITLGDVLGFTFYGREDLQVQLGTYLHDKEILLILDSCERSPEAQAWIAAQQMNAPNLRVLATARERLYVPREVVVELAGLPLPDPERGLTLEKAGATRLFLECARLNVPNFKPTAEDKAAIERICTLVDGLPLGIELAAAWVGALPCRDIADELEYNLDFLATTVNGKAREERNLRRLFETAWARLNPGLQQTLLRLSVFPADFAETDAAAVANCTSDELHALADKSMLQSQGNGRFVFHRILRQYAQEKMSPQVAQTMQRRFIEYYLEKLTQSLDALHGAEQLSTLEAIGREWVNHVQAWTWGLERREKRFLQQALPTLTLFMDMRGLWQDALRRLQEAMQDLWQGAPPPEEDEELLAMLLAYTGLFELRMGQTPKAETHLQRALALFEKHHVTEGIAYASYRLGDTAYGQGDYAKAESYYQRGLELYTALHDVWGQMAVLNNLANLLLNLGKTAEAQACYEKCLEYAKQSGEQWMRSTILSNLGNVRFHAGDLEAALTYNQEALSIKRALRGRMGIAATLLNLGNIYNLLNKPTIAEGLLQESLTVYREIGDWRGLAAAYEEMGHTYSTQKRHQEALEAFGESLRLRRLMNDRWGVVSSLKSVAQGLTQSGSPHLALEYLREAWQLLATLDAPPLRTTVLLAYAEVLTAQDMYDKAYLIVEVVLRESQDAINRLHATHLRQRLSFLMTEERRENLRHQAASLTLADLKVE